MSAHSDLIKTPEAARLYGRDPHTLYMWRRQGKGPDYVTDRKTGRFEGYRLRAIEMDLQRSTVKATGAPGRVRKPAANPRLAVLRQRLADLETRLREQSALGQYALAQLTQEWIEATQADIDATS